MLVYLSKKIAIPNDTLVASLAWHSLEGWLAVGGRNGLLRVLKLEVQHQDSDARIKGLAAPSTLTMNQTLEAHHSPVIDVAWNESKGRLTTCDADGLIVVWVLYKNTWTQEMINNRNKSAVSMVQWVKDGSKICIVYVDGAIIVGSVDGNRLWARELKGTSLTHVQWSPNGKVLLFGTAKGEILVYDSHGTPNSKLSIKCLNNCIGPVKLVGLDWYNGSNGFCSPNCPCLAVTFDNGRIQLMKDELDTDPVIMSTDDLQVSATAWNYNGSILAVGGAQSHQDDKGVSTVQFFNLAGESLSILRLPGRGLTSITWEGSGLRVAVGIAGHIYFANVRHDYKWGYFSNTLIYTYRVPGAREDCCMFWDTKTNDSYCKTCTKLLDIASTTDYCLLATRNNDTADKEKKYALLVCNSLGIPVESKFLPFEPTHVFISRTHVIAVIGNGLFVWHYRTSSRLAAPDFNAIVSQTIDTQDRFIHVDDTETQDHVTDTIDFSIAQKPTSDPVSAICASDRVLIVGRSSGTLQCYTLPHVALDHTFLVQSKPRLLSLNCNSTQLLVLDTGCFLSLYAMDGDDIGNKLSLERKEVWGLKWSEDNPHQYAIMEKTRMYIFRGVEPEEPIISSASLCLFKELEVTVVLMDELMKKPESPTTDLVFHLDTKSLRDTRQLLQHVSFQDSFQFIQDNPHPRLWQLLAESAIEKGNYEVAEKAFVCCQNYPGIQFIKRLRKLDTTEKRSAEVFSFLKKFEEAEKVYLNMDRNDLALGLRDKMGDPFRAYQLLKMSGGAVGNDTDMIHAWNAIGNYYAERLLWNHAIDYFAQAGNVERMSEGYYILEDYNKLEGLVDVVPEGNATLLESLGDQLASVGLCHSAVKAYLKCNKVRTALDCCIELNQWSEAVNIADRYGIKEVNNMLETQASALMEDNKILLLIQLYRNAKRFGEAAILLHKIALLADKRRLGPLKVKKLHVLSALMIEEYKKHLKEKQSIKRENTDRKQEVQSTLQELLIEETGFEQYSTLIDNPWRFAEYQHLYILAQRQLYNRQFTDSLRTLILLKSYGDVHDCMKVYSLLALAAKHCNSLHVCSQAICKLELVVDEDKKGSYESLAVQLFKDKPPRKFLSPLACPSCDTPIEQWLGVCPGCGTTLMVCMSSGGLIQTFSSLLCECCGHRMNSDVVNDSTTCGLCHSSLNNL